MKSHQNKHITKIKMKIDNEYYTPESIWKRIDLVFDKCKDKIIFEPFYGKGHSFETFVKMGFSVLGEKDLDFFSDKSLENIRKCDIIITNPPFSIKYKIMKLLVDENKSFCMILPLSCINTHSFRKCFENKLNEVCILMPKGRLSFIKNNKIQSSPSFESMFLTFKLFKENIIYID